MGQRRVVFNEIIEDVLKIVSGSGRPPDTHQD